MDLLSDKLHCSEHGPEVELCYIMLIVLRCVMQGAVYMYYGLTKYYQDVTCECLVPLQCLNLYPDGWMWMFQLGC